MTHSKLASRTHWTHQKASRDGARVDRFIIHHAATTSLATILHLFDGAREVSANYALGDGVIVATVPEEERAWTSGSYVDDRRAITVEVANSVAGGSYPVSGKEFDNLARLIADWATRYKTPITDDTVLTHQELYTRFGRSYATACPGDLQRRKSELLKLARGYMTGGAPAGKPSGGSAPVAPELEEDEEDMTQNIMYATSDKNYKYRCAVGNDTSGLWIEWVTGTADFNNKMAEKYKTGNAVTVGESMFNAARNAHAAVRPQSNITVTVGEEEGDG